MENQHTKKVADKVDEVLRVLDNNGNPTNKYVTRQYAHNNGIFHQEVAFIPVNSGGGFCFNAEAKTKNLIQTAGVYVLDMLSESKQRYKQQLMKLMRNWGLI